MLEARLELERRELTRAQMTRMLCRYRSSGAATPARIYGRALKMWLGGMRHHPHPEMEEHMANARSPQCTRSVTAADAAVQRE